MISGFTTSVSHDGINYQVQTEDKGRAVEAIVSLVYRGGTVLLSKRTPYEDLLGPDFDSDELARHLRHQHKVICAAVGAGKLEDLKRLAESEKVRTLARPRVGQIAVLGKQASASVEASASATKLSIKVDRRIRFKAGDDRALEVRVVRGPGEEPVRGAQVSIKVVGSNMRPQIFHAGTDSRGCAQINLRIPVFRSGRGAVVFKANDGDREAELRRVVRPF